MNKAVRIVMVLIVILIILIFGMSAYVTASVSGSIAGTDGGDGISQDAVIECKAIEPQCILVLGCAVWEDNQPSPMLKDRLDTAIDFYKRGVAPKLLLSGDNSIKEYSEPDCMLAYALKQGVPAEDTFLDFAGFSTYESVYRAHAVFQVDRAIVVTQKYHLFRALKACDALGITAKGAAANQQKYAGRYYREAREVLARDKDLVKGMIKAKPTFLGDEIPIDGDGTVTHLNNPEQDAAVTVTFVNDVYDADIWILPQTEENLETSLWGTATIGKLSKGAKADIAISDIAEDDMYIVRIIDTNQAFYSANDLLLEDGYTIHFATEDRPYDSTIDVLDREGNMISSEHAFEGVFGAE